MNFRDRLIEMIPDSLNWCTKYTGEPDLLRGVNNPAWMVYKLLFTPQDKCLMRVLSSGEKKEQCICCHDMWFNFRTLIFTTALAVFTVAMMFGAIAAIKFTAALSVLMLSSFLFAYIVALRTYGINACPSTYTVFYGIGSEPSITVNVGDWFRNIETNSLFRIAYPEPDEYDKDANNYVWLNDAAGNKNSVLTYSVFTKGFEKYEANNE